MKQATKKKESREPTIINIMKDGTVLTDISLYTYDPDKLPLVALRIVGHMLLGTYDKKDL